ncbi:MAG: right-handed parallel beta-helix repeat-containing protein, partial [Candidatus Aenigmarchaeota archaeon]|nr:right-handed parallel beta-helix repeat-containing protein [Candidatus Aenigmarchaeota archaeon]
ISSPPASPSGKTRIGDALNITNLTAGGFIDFNLSYTDSQISGLTESTIRIFRYNGTTWNTFENSTVNTGLNTVSSGNITTFSLFAPFGSSAQCGTVTESLTLNQNLTSNGTCITIGANNIVLDGNRFNITGNGSGMGINNTGGYDNVTIRNFAGINNFTIGINATTMENSTIVNNTIQAANVTTGFGINIASSSNNNLSLNTIGTTGSFGYGIYDFSSSDNNTFSANTITITGAAGVGIYIKSSSNATLLTNTITTTESTGYGIYVQSSSNNTLSANIIATNGSSGYGVYVQSSHNNTLSSNTITTNGDYGYPMYSSTSHNNTFSANTITTNGFQAFGFFVGSSRNNTFSANTITTTGQNGLGIYASGSVDNRFSSNTIATNGTNGHGIYTESSSSSNAYSNDTVTATNGNELYFDVSGNSITNMILGNSLNFSSRSFSQVVINVISSSPASPSGKTRLGDGLNITNLSSAGFIDFNLSYTDSQISGLTESTVRIYAYNNATSSWSVFSNSTVNTATNTAVSGNITVSGIYAAFGDITPTSSDNGNTGGGGGGGGGGTPSSSTSLTILPSAFAAGTPRTITVSNAALVVTQLVIGVTAAVSNPEIRLEKFSTKPADVPAPATPVLSYLKITLDNVTTSVLQSATITFNVSKSWIASNNLDTNNIALYRYTTAWDKLSTTKISEDGSSVFYQATTPGFSYFMVSSSSRPATTCGNNQCDAGETIATCPQDCTNAQPVCTPGARQCNNQQIETCVNGTWSVSQTCTTGCNATSMTCLASSEQKSETSSVTPWIAGLFILLGAGIGIWYWKKRSSHGFLYDIKSAN